MAELISPKKECTKRCSVGECKRVVDLNKKIMKHPSGQPEDAMLAIEIYGCDKRTYSVSLAPCVPVIASLRHDIGDVQVVDNIVRALKYSPDKASGQMPRDVAVERPDTGVVLVPLQNNV